MPHVLYSYMKMQLTRECGRKATRCFRREQLNAILHFFIDWLKLRTRLHFWRENTDLVNGNWLFIAGHKIAFLWNILSPRPKYHFNAYPY